MNWGMFLFDIVLRLTKSCVIYCESGDLFVSSWHLASVLLIMCLVFCGVVALVICWHALKSTSSGVSFGKTEREKHNCNTQRI